jgi:hypothetical protein
MYYVFAPFAPKILRFYIARQILNIKNIPNTENLTIKFTDWILIVKWLNQQSTRATRDVKLYKFEPHLARICSFGAKFELKNFENLVLMTQMILRNRESPQQRALGLLCSSNGQFAGITQLASRRRSKSQRIVMRAVLASPTQRTPRAVYICMLF